MLQGICRALEDSVMHKSDTGAIIGQFITTCEIDHHVLSEWERDECFPSFVQHLLQASYSEEPDRTNICVESDLPRTIVQFLSNLALKHPGLHDVITANTNLDEFVINLLTGYVDKCHTQTIKSTEIFPFLKFIALIVNSDRVEIKHPKSANLVIKIAASLLSNPQLSAWASAIIAGLHRNSSIAAGCLKSMPNLLQVKRDLAMLMSSSDICVVCAAISAMVTLFSIGTDSVSAMRAMIHFIGSESQFPLMRKLAADAILDLVKRTQLTQEQITLLLMAVLKTQGSQAVVVLNLILQMSSYHPTIAQIVKVTEYLEQFIDVLISHEEDFIAPFGCQLLIHLHDCDSELFDALSGTNVFSKLLMKLPTVGDNLYESYVMLLRMLSAHLKKSDVKLLTDAEDFLFTMFLRQIEQNNGFLSLIMFLFLHACAKYIKPWSMRIKRIVIDTPFPVLVVNVLEESRDHHTTRDALLCLQYFTNHREASFFDLFSTAFVMLAKNRHQELRRCEQEAESEKKMKDEMIQELTTVNRDNEAELKTLREAHSQLITAYNEERTLAEHQSEQVSEQNNGIRTENSELKVKVETAIEESKAKGAEIAKLQEENRALKEKLLAAQMVQCDREGETMKLKESIRQLEGFTAQNFALRQAEDKLSEAEHTNYLNSQRILELESELRIQMERKKSMENEMAQLREELVQEQDRAQQIVNDMELVERQNEELRSVQKDINHVKRKYAAKRKQLEAALIAADKEKRKWESIARFGLKVQECKSNIAQEVYAAAYPE